MEDIGETIICGSLGNKVVVVDGVTYAPLTLVNKLPLSFDLKISVLKEDNGKGGTLTIYKYLEKAE